MERKKIIIDEIKHWKKSRLLPDHYCNFLLTLYSEGEEISEVTTRNNSSNQFKQIIIMTIGLVFFGLSFLVIYFTDFSPILQTGLTVFFSIVMFGLASYVKRFSTRFIHLYILLGALVLFLATIHGVSAIFPGQQMAIATAVIITCIAWVVIGKKYKLNYLVISGIVGLIIVIYFIIR